MFDTIVTADTGGLFYSLLTSGKKYWKAKQNQNYDIDFGVPSGGTHQHSW